MVGNVNCVIYSSKINAFEGQPENVKFKKEMACEAGYSGKERSQGKVNPLIQQND